MVQCSFTSQTFLLFHRTVSSHGRSNTSDVSSLLRREISDLPRSNVLYILLILAYISFMLDIPVLHCQYNYHPRPLFTSPVQSSLSHLQTRKLDFFAVFYTSRIVLRLVP